MKIHILPIPQGATQKSGTLEEIHVYVTNAAQSHVKVRTSEKVVTIHSPNWDKNTSVYWSFLLNTNQTQVVVVWRTTLLSGFVSKTTSYG